MWPLAGGLAKGHPSVDFSCRPFFLEGRTRNIWFVRVGSGPLSSGSPFRFRDPFEFLWKMVSLQPGPSPGRNSADFLKASLEVRYDCGPASEEYGPRSPGYSGQSVLEVVGRWACIAPGRLIATQDHSYSDVHGPHSAFGPGARSVEAVLLVRVGQRRLTH